jgi:hypothetical protein
MEAWACSVVERLHELDVSAIVRLASDGESPQVHFVSDGVALDGDATSLVLGIDALGVRAGLELPATQARGARARLADPARALELSTALETLPEQFTLASSGDFATADAQRAKADDIRGLLDRIDREHRTMWIGWSLPRELALEHATLLDEQLEDAIVALAQVFALLAGDAAAQEEPGGVGDRRFAGRGAKGGGGRAEEDRERTAGVDRKGHGPRQRVEHSRIRGRDRERDGDGDESDTVEAVAEAPAPRARGLAAKIPPRPGLRSRPSKGTQVAVERGAKVRVLKGPFSGKVGVVHDLDGKGGARVMLGLLAVRLEVSNLLPSPEGRGRPVLSTSHRKPLPERS